MPTRESEVVTYFRGDEPLDDLSPGGVYAHAELSEAALTDPLAMPDVWADGEFQTTTVVRERAPVPTGDVQSTRSQRTSYSQAIEVWVYGLTAEAIEATLNRVYTLMMGKRLTKAFSATWIGPGLPIGQAPELLAAIKMGRNDYRIVSIRTPVEL